MRRHRDVLGRLYAEYHEVNDRHFAGLLPMLPIHIEVVSRPGKVSTWAYLWTDDSQGVPRYIVMDQDCALKEAWDEVIATLRHEMIHVWQAVSGRKVDHGPVFKRMCRRLSISEKAVD